MDDIGALLEWIGRDRGLNSSRIMVTGASYGGLLSLMAAATFSDRIACAASAVGIADLLGYVEEAPEDERESRRAEYADERDPATRAFLRRFSPVNRGGEIRKPLLVVAAANDARIPVPHPRAVRDAVRNRGTPVWYVEASNEGHGYERGDNRDFAFYMTTMFSTRCLLE